MPPAPDILSRSETIATHFPALKDQWKNPEDILSILMIIGGDIVQSALSQLISSHPRPFTPVAFSFGWVAYSFSAILSAVGSRQLVPEPDCRCILIEASSGYSRDVNSWVLSRLVRDYKRRHNQRTGLEITFFDTVPDKQTGVPDRDWVYYQGVLVILLQIAIAAIPGAIDGNWLVMIVTCSGNLLAQIQAALPQWRQELWGARQIKPRKQEVICLTKGNGSPYVMVIRSSQDQLRLADLASGTEAAKGSRLTVFATLALTVLWFVLLLTMQGVEDGHWYMLVIGAVGMLQNVIAAGARREPAALGFHLKQRVTFHCKKVFETLTEAEKVERNVGLDLLDVFFPAGLREHEEKWRQEMKDKYRQEKESLKEISYENVATEKQ
ncbi:hypothetical protein E1B28_012513 [Marasmius oreades]|uniref:Uncharacterized protein n=1 Tax=Marasmius oreades TaxID=181124 RepID=A0A9P7RRU2_9AGAR|nr:uncharacterized protein E1B28_012513 [Marasmius oreades]KAG7088530.1 hypothetical protein E1B28_012513 [Marasmius oreades]